MRRIVGTLVLLVLDGVWLGAFMAPQYARMIPLIQGSPLRVRYASAAMAYAMMVTGLQVFVLDGHPRGAVRACLFGSVLYGVFDFTCGAVFDRWDPRLAAIDVAWGGTVYVLAYLAAEAARGGRAR